MNRKTLIRLRRELKELRRNFAPLDSKLLEGLAAAVGRKKVNRGKEPTWDRSFDPHLSPPLSIPNHSKGVKARTARSILDQLIADLDEWEQFLDLLVDEDDDDE